MLSPPLLHRSFLLRVGTLPTYSIMCIHMYIHVHHPPRFLTVSSSCVFLCVLHHLSLVDAFIARSSDCTVAFSAVDSDPHGYGGVVESRQRSWLAPQTGTGQRRGERTCYYLGIRVNKKSNKGLVLIGSLFLKF